MEGHEVAAVEVFRELLDRMLDTARATKQTSTVDPALIKSDFTEHLQRLQSLGDFPKTQELKRAVQYAVIETVAREVFYALLASSTIDQPTFVDVWNLLDIISILSDEEECDPALLFWLVEELLDSQTIAGCRKIFDFLESRRERITANHFKQKNLVILRSCNELLRRLSRAEDTAFCGRVFIFMFQSFPLGDRSSVNLRGEYHVENVTTYDELPSATGDDMEIDSGIKSPPTGPAADNNAVPLGSSGTTKGTEENKTTAKSVTFNAKGSQPEEPLDPDKLYPIFWALQQSFSQPKKLFDQERFADFRKGLEATMITFKSVQSAQAGRGPAKSAEEGRRGTKRKRSLGDDDLANAFNPKYLTSRDLFELEISDISFRRHILVQTLIIMDFLLSLTAKAKEKLAMVESQNKSVTYQDQVLNEEDAKWAIDTKRTIAEYLKKDHEGPFFYRMVETVLSRDKNWVRWKIENCPSIERRAISTEEYISAKSGAKKATTNKRLRAMPLMSLDLSFLREGDGSGGMDKSKDSSRYRLPSLESFKNKIALDDMEIDLPTNPESKDAAIYGKASKSWRALRIASKSKLISFDRIDDSEKIDIIFEDDSVEPEPVQVDDDESADIDDTEIPTDRRPLVFCGSNGVGKSTLIQMLLTKHPKQFGIIRSHTSRSARVGETSGVEHHFVDVETYSVMRDGDQFLEITSINGDHYGTSRKVVEGIIASGKIPVMEMDYQGVQQLKDQNYPIRVIYLGEPSMEELERRLRARGTDSDEEIQTKLSVAKAAVIPPKTEGFHDFSIINDDLTKTFDQLKDFIFGKVENTVTVEAVKDETVIEVVPVKTVDMPQVEVADVAMEDGETTVSEGVAAT